MLKSLLLDGDAKEAKNRDHLFLGAHFLTGGCATVSRMSGLPSVRLRGILHQTASWARILEDGALELEFFDYSSEAHSSLGNDVAWTYRVEACEKARVCHLLAAAGGTPVEGDPAMLDAIVKMFGDTWRVRDWLKEQSIPYAETFDSWA